VPGRREAGGRAVTTWWLAGLLAVAATLTVATYQNLEASVLGMLIAGVVLAIVIAKPEVGIFLLMTNFLIASYPSPIRGEGLLTINNLLGIILSVLLVAKLAQHPDFWFLRVKQLHILIAIGVIFIISSVAASYQFPELRVTRGTFRNLDQTLPLAQDFVTRLAFFVLTLAFLRRKRDLKRAFTLMMLCLVMVVPSALLGYATGHAQAGYRAAAEFSVGTNPNRLAFICLIQIAFWWYFSRTQRFGVRLACIGVIASLVFTVFLTASRSGVLGLGIMMFLLSRTRGAVRGGRMQMVALALVAVGLLVTVIPQENIDRLQNLNPFATRKLGGEGSSSTERRVTTVETGWQIFGDYPVFGIGLGNFREVARQVYRDPFYRPPHNSYIWSLSEGGIFCALLYVMLFAVTWRDVRWLQRSPAVPPDLRWIAAALEPSLVLIMFYSAFADIWLSPIIYIVIGLTIVFRRYVSLRRVVVV
jgi:O-antigen ligase